MSMGRCSGCGLTHISCKKVRSHVTMCPDYLALYRKDKSKCLDPTDEYKRWLREEGSDDAKAENRERKLEARFAELDGRRVEQVERWKPRNLLED